MGTEDIKGIINDIKNYIDLEKESGIEDFMLKNIFSGRNNTSFSPHVAHKKHELDLLQKKATHCNECELFKSRRNLVFGCGNIDAELMFIGEAPGLEEDIQGEPFVGKAGALLTKMIEAMGLKRTDVYIANCLKCRPPNNRQPMPSEVIACREFLMGQIEIVMPKVICCLGKFASQTLLMSEEPITKMRGIFRDFEGINVMPTFHPAYLLRNPQDKRLTWQDLKKIRDRLRS